MSITEQAKQLIHQGNIHKVVITREGRIVASFPVTLAVIGAVIAPPLAAAGLVLALVTQSTIRVERTGNLHDDGASDQDRPTNALTV